jgi:DNA-directed RNA polymerase subunit RPC12/RpoP
MAIERLKFRCYRCNQLLGATPNKAGSVVTCPKCSAELLIPVPDLRADEGSEVQPNPPAPARPKTRAEPRSKPDQDVTATVESTAVVTAVQAMSRPAPRATSVDDLAAVLPPDLIDLRPEDLRVEAEFFESLARQPPAPPPVQERAPWPPSEVLEAPILSENFAAYSPAPPVVATPVVPPPADVPPATVTQTVNLAPVPEEPLTPPPVPQRAEAALIGASIEIEHPTILPPGTEIRRVREVVLPAAVVLSWSLFVLLGIALAFVAGLLMGHFLWTTH